MLVIRLQRIGKKGQPSYRIVVAERRSKMGAPPVEDCGSYNPFTKAVQADKARLEHWVKTGAKPSVSVWNLLVGAGVLQGPTMAVKMKKKKEEVAAVAAAPAAAAPAAKTSAPAPEAKQSA